MFSNWQAANALTLIGLCGGLIAFLFAFYQYVRSQRWKRAEWVAAEVTRFLDDPKVDAALKMLDWGERPSFFFRKKRIPHIDSSDPAIVSSLGHWTCPRSTVCSNLMRAQFETLVTACSMDSIGSTTLSRWV